VNYPAAATRDYRVIQRLRFLVLDRTQRAWAGMGEDFDESWATVGPQVTRAVTAGQLAAATQGAEAVAAVVDELDVDAPAQARVVPGRLAGVASDGRPLTGLLEGAVVQAKVASAAGLSVQEALASGGERMRMLVRTAVADAHRDALAAGIVARDRVGWVRMVNPPCCGDCAALAGRWYRWSDGFDRHPNCDCEHIVAPESVSSRLVVDPQDLYDRGLVTTLNGEQRRRIDSGVPLVTVVNDARDARRVTRATERLKRKAGAPAPRPSLDGLLGQLRADVASREQGRARLAAAGFLAA